MMKDYYLSPLGEIILAAEDGALIGLWFRGQKFECAGLSAEEKSTERDGEILSLAKIWLDSYFSGEDPTVTFPISPRGTDFQKRVWKELLNIPYGETLSYGQLAEKVGCRSARAVGSAVGKNPVSLIVPCHRVMGANGSLTGYAGGIKVKKQLLELEKKFT